MLEYRLDNSVLGILDSGNGVMASSEASEGVIGYVYSGLWKEMTTYFAITHIMTKWGGRVKDKKRQLALIPFSVNSTIFPCSSGKFSREGIDYIFNTFETEVCKGDDFIHQSDVVCSVLEGRFSANSKDDFQIKLTDYINLINALYTRFYDNGNSPRIILQFSESHVNNREFRCVMNNHSQEDIIREDVKAGISSEEKYTHYGRKPREIKWEDIGGLFIPKIQIKDFLDDFYDPETSRSLGLDPSERGGIFLFGDTGNGKTLFAEAVATELSQKYNDNFVSFFIDYSHLASEFRGVETRRTHELFESVNYVILKDKRVLLFLDEAQKIVQRTTCSTNRHVNAVLDQMLIETSRFDYGKCILMAATAQDPSTIDQQLMRPGRFGTHIFFNNPTLEEAVDILQKGINKRISESKYPLEELISKQGIDYQRLAEQTQGLTLAELYFLVIDVFKGKLRELRKSHSFTSIKTDDFEEPIKLRRISKSKTMSRETVI